MSKARIEDDHSASQSWRVNPDAKQMTPTTWFDSHCHFDDKAFDGTRAERWQHCQALGIQHLLVPGLEPVQWHIAQSLCAQFTGLVFAAGIHPWFVAKHFDEDSLYTSTINVPKAITQSLVWPDLTTALSQPNCVAIGECGLDYRYPCNRDLQNAVLEHHILLAKSLQKPLILHCVAAHNDLIRLLKRHHPKMGGILHAFTGSVALAMEYLRLGFLIGIGGAITYPRARKTQATLRALPLEGFVLETDAPAMPLYGSQGQNNCPSRLVDVAQQVAALRNEPLALIAAQTTRNAQNIFGISPCK